MITTSYSREVNSGSKYYRRNLKNSNLLNESVYLTDNLLHEYDTELLDGILLRFGTHFIKNV